jgi:aminocarboxymuconate-semialdehyde decarboxylase
MNVVDSHFHWWPRSIFEALCKRSGYPRAEHDGKGGFNYYRRADCTYVLPVWPAWFDLDDQFRYMDETGHHISGFGSIGPFSVHFSDLPKAEGKEAAIAWNEAMAEQTRLHPGRFWASAAIPFIDAATAVEVLDDAVLRLGLKGANVPGSVGDDPFIDAPRLEPFYARAEELGVPIFLHPTDALFADALAGYGGDLHRMGRVVEVSVAASRLIFSGIMDRYPNLKIVMSHTGGALPYQAGRFDKNGTGSKLAEKPSWYLKRLYTDTVSPHTAGMKFAIEFFGADRVMYGSDYPCWDPKIALPLLEAVGLSPDDREKVLNGNARRILQLDAPVRETTLA